MTSSREEANPTSDHSAHSIIHGKLHCASRRPLHWLLSQLQPHPTAEHITHCSLLFVLLSRANSHTSGGHDEPPRKLMPWFYPLVLLVESTVHQWKQKGYQQKWCPTVGCNVWWLRKGAAKGPPSASTGELEVGACSGRNEAGRT